MPARRYDINILVNQQTNPPAPPPPPNPNQPAPPGSPSSLEQLAKYATGIYAIQRAWGLARSAADDYAQSMEKLSENQRSATEKFLDFERRKRAYMFAAGGLDPSKRAAAGEDLNRFSASHGFASPSAALTFAERWESDVTQYTTGKNPLIDKDSERSLRGWVADFSIAAGIPEKQANQGAAAIIGSTNWLRKYGKDKAASNVMAKYARVSQILSAGKGDPETNWRTFAKLLNQSVTVAEGESRVLGDDAIEKVAVSARNAAEFDPEQAETYARNRMDFLRQFSKPAVARELKKAGVVYESPEAAEARLIDRYKSLKMAKKLPDGITFGDFVRNIMKGNIRAAIGMQASFAAGETGAGEASYKNAINEIKPENVAKKGADLAAADRAMAVDKARQSSEAADRGLGARWTSLQEIEPMAKEWYTAKGYGDPNDPRSMFERGTFRSWNPLALGNGSWEDVSSTRPRSDYGNWMLYKELIRRNYPSGMVPMEGGQSASADYVSGRFYRLNEGGRDRALMNQAQVYENATGKKVTDLLQELIDLAKRGDKANVNVPQVPQQPGMVRP